MYIALSRWIDPELALLVAFGGALAMQTRAGKAVGRAARIARIAAWTSWAALWILSTPIVADAATAAVDWPTTDPIPAVASTPEDRTAIVVLGAGIKTDDPHVLPRDRLNGPGIARALGGARVFAEHPSAYVVLSGGPPNQSEAMADAVASAGVPKERIVVELDSMNTRQNAIEAAAILRARPVDRVVLVTSALHMRRSVREFARVGVVVVPAPVDYNTLTTEFPRDLFPDSGAILKSYLVAHELLGMLRP